MITEYCDMTSLKTEAKKECLDLKRDIQQFGMFGKLKKYKSKYVCEWKD